jgi:hypothetical protein
LNVTIDFKTKKVTVHSPVEIQKLMTYLEKSIGRGYKKYRIVSDKTMTNINYYPAEPKFGYLHGQ